MDPDAHSEVPVRVTICIMTFNKTSSEVQMDGDLFKVYFPLKCCKSSKYNNVMFALGQRSSVGNPLKLLD